MNPLSKILLVGAFSDSPEVYTYASSFNVALQKLGYHVTPYNYRKKILPGPLALFNHRAINKALIKKAIAIKPDLVFLVKAENINATTLAFIKKNVCSAIINFYPDNPFVFWNGNSNQEVLKALPVYSCFLTWSQMLIPPLFSAGCAHVCSFPFAYDEDIFSYAPADFSARMVRQAHHERTRQTARPAVPTEALRKGWEPVEPFEQDLISLYEKKYAADVCFVGTWEPMREQQLVDLMDKLPHIDLAIWGNDWKEKCQSGKLKKQIRGKAIYSDELIQAFRTSKIVLNFIRVQNMTSHNMRTFEVPASGSFLLTQYTHEQAEIFFKDGISVACFTSPEDLAQKVLFYLHNEDVRLTIAQKGYQQAQNFTLTKQLKNYFNNCPHLHT